MDNYARQFPAVRDGDLMISADYGVAYQSDMAAGRVAYGDDYFAKVSAYEDTEIARAVNHGRVAMLARHLKPHTWVLDYGAGTGAFVRAAVAARFHANGFEVMPKAANRLRDDFLYASDPSGFDAVTAWDVIEHIDEPAKLLRAVREGCFLFVSLPILDDLANVRRSKHFRPGEHLYYFTAAGFVGWMALYGYHLLEQSAHETEAGREGIGAFAFRRQVRAALLDKGVSAKALESAH